MSSECSMSSTCNMLSKCSTYTLTFHRGGWWGGGADYRKSLMLWGREERDIIFFPKLTRYCRRNLFPTAHPTTEVSPEF